MEMAKGLGGGVGEVGDGCVEGKLAFSILP